jgi:ribonuclease BN (tRNA processing enzyme)
VWGLAALGEPSSLSKWPIIDVYLPRPVAYHFDQELSYMQNSANVHGTQVEDRFELPDAAWTVLKTTHTADSVSFILESSKKLVYLVDSVVPPPETVNLLKDLDYLVLEATADELALQKGERWESFSLPQAIEFWRQVEADRCILTYLSCHSWKNKELVAGLSHEERFEYEKKKP